LSPNRNLGIVRVEEANAMGVLPKNFANQQVIGDQFELYILFILDVGLN